ncbi:MAG: hypothetical protein J7K72_00190 [Candidatus Aenigmarchaeota archaeon]|nr:hypothetical protein [Candidatus Aenigmarchaeota archaeon]
MREDFRCVACGYNFAYDFKGKSMELVCPKCNQKWKIEASALGFFRLYMWL